MARILFALVVLLLLLNGMTFLLVVNQESGSEKAQAQTSSQSTSRAPNDQDQHALKLDKISQSIQTVQKSVTDLSREVKELQKRVAQNAARSIPDPVQPDAVAAPAPAAAPPATGGAKASRGSPSRTIPRTLVVVRVTSSVVVPSAPTTRTSASGSSAERIVT